MLWCATQVSGQKYAEFIFFVSLIALTTGMIWHLFVWQRKIMLTLHALQTQVQDATFAMERQVDGRVAQLSDRLAQAEERLLGELYEQCNVLAQFFKPANFAQAGTMLAEKLRSKLDEVLGQLQLFDGSDAGPDSQKAKQWLEITARLSTLSSLATELASVHKLLASQTTDLTTILKVLQDRAGDFDKLPGIFNRCTEINGLILQINGDMATQKGAGELEERLQKNLERKLEDCIEKLAVLRVVVDQYREKTVSAVKDHSGWISKGVNDCTSLIRGLGPLVPQTKVMLEQLGQGKEASEQAQRTLQATGEAVQNCEHRLMRIESLTTGAIDQLNEADQVTRGGFESLMSEMPQLQEILSRLPKLPQRKPPAEKPVENPPSSSTTPMTHPSTPPTTLGPSTTSSGPHNNRTHGHSSAGGCRFTRRHTVAALRTSDAAAAAASPVCDW